MSRLRKALLKEREEIYRLLEPFPSLRLYGWNSVEDFTTINENGSLEHWTASQVKALRMIQEQKQTVPE